MVIATFTWPLAQPHFHERVTSSKITCAMKQKVADRRESTLCVEVLVFVAPAFNGYNPARSIADSNFSLTPVTI
eukprot:1354255-Amphidinium_carterae.1